MDNQSDARPLEQVVGQILSVKTNSIRRFEGQPREHFDPLKLEELGNSILEVGQVQPIDVRGLIRLKMVFHLKSLMVKDVGEPAN